MSNIDVHNVATHDELNDLTNNIQVVTPVTLAVVNGHANANLELDASQYQQFLISVDDDVTINPVNGMPGEVIIVALTQGSNGGTITPGSAIDFAGGSAPSWSSSNGYTDVVTLVFDGTEWQETARSVGNH